MFKCSLCELSYSSRAVMLRHERSVHGRESRSTIKFVKTNDGKKRSFDSWEEFLQWKNEQEASTNDRFNIASNSRGYYYYKCYLSGHWRKPTEGGEGGSGCRAFISARKPKDGGPVNVKFLFEHNHDKSEKVRLSALDRSFIKERAKMGMSHDRILADARATTANGTSPRLHTLTKKDIWNVLRSPSKPPPPEISSSDLESGQDVGETLTQLFQSMTARVPELTQDQRVRALCSLKELKSNIFDKTS